MQRNVFIVRAAIGAVTAVTVPASSVMADTAFFDPALRTVAVGQVAEFDLYLTPMSLASFDAADVIIGSDDLPDLDFEYSPAFLSAMENVSAVFSDQGYYPQDVFMSGFSTDGAIAGNLLMGTVRASTDGLAAGDYTLRIDGSTDMISALSLDGFEFEPIVTGDGGPVVATVRIPEPSMGLGFGLLAMLGLPRRRGDRK